MEKNQEISDRFWKAALSDLKRGYVFEEDTHSLGRFICLIDGKMCEKGVIYQEEGVFYEAERYMQHYIQQQHTSMFSYLLELDKKWTGLTDIQSGMVQSFYQGRSDTEIVAEVGGSKSTIRNHRFALREKTKQAKVFLAIMELLEEQQNDPAPLVSVHRTATMVDERYAVTEKESKDILNQYFPDGLEGSLTNFPRKEKRKIVILRHLMNGFELGKKYTEKEVNEVLKRSFADYVTLRRYMIEYGFMDRLDDGSQYWVKQ